MESPVISPTTLARPARRWELPVGLAVVFGLSLALTAGKIFDPAVVAKYSTNTDILEIAQGAQDANATAVRGWWTGGWIQQSAGYYRPMSSMLFLAEYRIWGRQFQPYFLVSWICHALNTTLIALLAFRLRGKPGRRGLFIALVAGLLFNLRHGPTGGPEWTGERLTLNLMPYWPAQTDLFSLLFSLAALVALDRGLYGNSPTPLATRAPAPGDLRSLVREGDGARPPSGGGWCAAAIGLYVVALLFKEMAVSVPLLAASLAWYRLRGPAGTPSASALPADAGSGATDTPQLDGGGCAAVGDTASRSYARRVAGVFVAFMIPAGAVLLVRHLWVPKVIEPSYRSGEYVGQKVAQYLSQPLTTFIGAGDYWLFVAVIGAAVAGWACLKYRISVIWMALGAIAWCGAVAQVMGGNFALITIPMQLGRLGLIALFLAGAALLLTGRRALLWMLGLWVALIHMPVLHVWGPHYLYWPAAFWALLNACLLDEAIDRAPTWARRLRV